MRNVICGLILGCLGCAPIHSNDSGARFDGLLTAKSGAPTESSPRLPPLAPTYPGDDLVTADGHSDLADRFVRVGLVSEAILEYHRAIALDPSNPVRHFKLGLVYQSLRQFDEALGAYREAARLEPDSAWAHAAISIVYAKMGDPEAAFESYRAVKGLDREMAKGLLEVILQYGNLEDV